MTYYNPATNKRVTYPWKEHHIGIVVTHTELKIDGVEVIETGANQDTRNMDGREEHVLANILEGKLEDLAEDYTAGLDTLLHEDGTGDTKSLSGIKALIPDDPTAGSTGGLSRVVNTWWRNRAATAAYAAAGGQDVITVNVANGGALLQFLQKEKRQLTRFAQGVVTHRCFAGSDFIDGMEKELRANGRYTQSGFGTTQSVDGALDTSEFVPFGTWKIVYDPSLDSASLSKRLYVIDMRAIKLKYMSGQRMKRHTPARPYDRYVLYQGITTTGVLCARQLNTSAVYDIA